MGVSIKYSPKKSKRFMKNKKFIDHKVFLMYNGLDHEASTPKMKGDPMITKKMKTAARYALLSGMAIVGQIAAAEAPPHEQP